MDMREIIRLVEQKIVAYHGTGQKFDSFKSWSLRPHFFTQDLEYAKAYCGKTPAILPFTAKKATPRNYILTVELDISRPLDTKTDPDAVDYYNDEFVPYLNVIHQKYNQPAIPKIAIGKHVSFVYVDDLWRYMI